MKKWVCCVALLFGLTNIPAYSATPPKAGSICTKQGSSSNYQGKTFTCIKSGNKLVWNKGVLINKVTTPSSTTTSKVIKVTEISQYLPSEACKLMTNLSGTAESNESHALRNFLKPDLSKPLRILLFPVDFPDLVSADSNAPEVLNTLKVDFSAFYKSQSNGKLSFSWTISPKFTRMNKSISSYGVGRNNPLSNSGNYWKFNYDLQDLAMQTYKREDFDVFIAVSPKGTSEDLIATSPAFFTQDSKYWPANWLGGDYWRDEQKWFYPAHEFGHYVLGLDDLRPPAIQAGQNSSAVPMGHYDIMNTQAAPEFTAWNRWIAGLINDNQILCLPNSTTVSKLKPIELVNDEVKGLVIPISNSKVIVIENRAALGYDSKIPLTSVGVIAYSVDVSVPRSQSPMKLIREPSAPVDQWNKERGLVTPRIDALKNGEFFSYEGITIRVIGQEGNDMFIEVKKS